MGLAHTDAGKGLVIYESRNLRMGLADGLCVVCVGIYESRNLRMGLAKNRLVDACHLSTKVEI